MGARVAAEMRRRGREWIRRQIENEMSTTGNCCFMPGTKIRLADGTDKNIEDVQVGDQVSCYNLEDGKSEHTHVEFLKLQKVIWDGYVLIRKYQM